MINRHSTLTASAPQCCDGLQYPRSLWFCLRQAGRHWAQTQDVATRLTPSFCAGTRRCCRPFAWGALRRCSPPVPWPSRTSGHSAFSAAAAAVLRLFTGSARFGASHTFPAGSSTIEPGLTPARDVTLRWRTFEEAAAEAGWSRRYGGIHFRQEDMESRWMGEQIGRQTYQMATGLFGPKRHPEREPL